MIIGQLLVRILDHFKEQRTVQLLRPRFPFLSVSSFFHSRYTASPDDDVFRYLARVYADNHPDMHIGRSCDASDGFQNTKGKSKWPHSR